jgi:hypothetical protein
MAVISSPQLSGIEKGDVIAGLQACEADKTRKLQKTNSLFACSAAVLAWLAVTAAIAVLFQQHAPVEYVVSGNCVLLAMPTNAEPDSHFLTVVVFIQQ